MWDVNCPCPFPCAHAMPCCDEVTGGPLITVRRRVVRTQVPRSPDTPIRKRARPRRFNPETGREYSPLR